MRTERRTDRRPDLISLILAGGKGIRLWPLSTQENPKQFMRLIGGKSFLQMAHERALSISPGHKIFISTLGHLAQRTLQELPGFPEKNLILEPMPRNTGPALAYAAFLLRKFGDDSIMAVLPADHYIGEKKIFQKAVEKAARKAREEDCFVIFGIQPEHPSTEYGYIEIQKRGGSNGLFKVKKFLEKPSLKRAKELLKQGNHFWNSGMFVWSIGSLIRGLQRFAPDIYFPIFGSPSRSKGILSGDHGKAVQLQDVKRAFQAMRSESIDYAVMEKADNYYMIELKTEWKDFGSWLSVDEYLKKDEKGNFRKGDIHSEVCTDSTLWSEDGKICAVGLKDILVVSRRGNILILHKSKGIDPNRIKRILKQILNS